MWRYGWGAKTRNASLSLLWCSISLINSNTSTSTQCLSSLSWSVCSVIVHAGCLFWCFRWVEQDPKEIMSTVYHCLEQIVLSCKDLKINPADIKGLRATVMCNWILGVMLWNKMVLVTSACYHMHLMVISLCNLFLSLHLIYSCWHNEPKRDHYCVG